MGHCKKVQNPLSQKPNFSNTEHIVIGVTHKKRTEGSEK
jgi:hypothetical protein